MNDPKFTPNFKKKLMLAIIVGILYATKVLTGLIGTLLIVAIGIFIISFKTVLHPVISFFEYILNQKSRQ